MVTNKQINSHVILVQACSWSERRQHFAKIEYFSFKRKVLLPFAKTPNLNPQVLNVGGLFGSSVCWKTFVKYNFVKIYFLARVSQQNIKYYILIIKYNLWKYISLQEFLRKILNHRQFFSAVVKPPIVMILLTPPPFSQLTFIFFAWPCTWHERTLKSLLFRFSKLAPLSQKR